MAKRSKRPIVAFKVSKRIGSFIVRVRGIVTNFIANAAVFTTPSPTTTVASGHIDDLQTAEDAVQTKLLGTTTARDLKYDLVLEDMFKWQGYVQNLVDAENDPAAKLNIIMLSGYDVKVSGSFQKPPLAVKATLTTGMVKLVAKSAGRRASYEWQQSVNPTSSWVNLPVTLRADTVVSGLTSGTRYYFRVRSITKDGTSAWSTAVSIVIQ